MNVAQIDRNFAVQTSLDIEGIKFYNIEEEPFSVYGVFLEDGCYRRLPDAVAQTVSEGVAHANKMTSGGRIKFRTNSPYVAIHAKYLAVGQMAQFALTGSAGFDLYVGKKEEYAGVFIPPRSITDGYESVVRFESGKEREITINFPLFSLVSEVYIGLDEKATVKKSAGYKHTKPIVFYGSSITQGACASRPGNSCVNMVARALQSNYINLAFTGNAKGEQEIAEYIAGLDMSVFVYDYDHNAPDAEHLEKTHQRMFHIIRRANPNLPIVLMPAPCYAPDEKQKMRAAIVKKTYDDAIAAGDKNVYFIDGKTLMKYAKMNGFADYLGCHPNDLGFYSMAQALIPQLRKLI